MSDSGPEPDELAEIRERKRERLQKRIESGGEASGTGGADGADAAGQAGRDDPLPVDGESHLDAVVADHEVVLVEFGAEWCGPCQMLEPVLEEIAATTGAVVATVDIDDNDRLAREYGVRGVPTLFLFVDGEAVERLVGMQDEATLRQLVGAHA